MVAVVFRALEAVQAAFAVVDRAAGRKPAAAGRKPEAVQAA
jgi:hypothetical protein